MITVFYLLIGKPDGDQLKIICASIWIELRRRTRNLLSKLYAILQILDEKLRFLKFLVRFITHIANRRIVSVSLQADTKWPGRILAKNGRWGRTVFPPILLGPAQETRQRIDSQGATEDAVQDAAVAYDKVVLMWIKK